MNAAFEEGRLAYVEVTWAFVLQWLRGAEGAPLRTNLPEDARVVGLYVDDWTRSLRVRLTSMTFASVLEGASLPRFELEIR